MFCSFFFPSFVFYDQLPRLSDVVREVLFLYRFFFSFSKSPPPSPFAF